MNDASHCTGGYLLSPASPCSLALTPGRQHAGHAPVRPPEALGAQLVPQLRRTVLPGLPALPEIRPIRIAATAIPGAAFALGEARPCEPVAEGPWTHPDLLRDDRPRVALVPQRTGALVLR